jgi:hypothetical protein
MLECLHWEINRNILQSMPQEGARSKYTFPIVALILVVLAAGAWFIYQKNINQDNSALLSEQFMWTLTPSTNATGSSTTEVALRVAGVDVPVRTMEGTCTEIAKNNVTLLPGELSGIICLTEGTTGTELGVFKEGDTLILKQGTVNGTERTGFNEINQEGA